MPKKTKLPKDNLLMFIEYLLLIIILSLTTLNLQKGSTTKNVLGLSTEVLSSNIDNEQKTFLKTILSQNPTYLDGIIEMAKLEIIDKNFDSARKYLDLAKEINPNSNEVKEILTDLDKLIL